MTRGVEVTAPVGCLSLCPCTSLSVCVCLCPSVSMCLPISKTISLCLSVCLSVNTYLPHRHQREPQAFRDGQEYKPGEEDPYVVPQPLLRLQGEGSEAGEEGDDPQLDAHHGDGVHVAGGG